MKRNTDQKETMEVSTLQYFLDKASICLPLCTYVCVEDSNSFMFSSCIVILSTF